MRIDLLTVLPEMLESPLNCSIIKRARDKGLVEIHVHNLRDYTTNKHRKVDDYPFGGEAGMVMQIEPIDRAISALKAERDYDEVIFTSPDGETFNQGMANSLSLLQNIIILCGHYKGIDYRMSGPSAGSPRLQPSGRIQGVARARHSAFGPRGAHSRMALRAGSGAHAPSASRPA